MVNGQIINSKIANNGIVDNRIIKIKIISNIKIFKREKHSSNYLNLGK